MMIKKRKQNLLDGEEEESGICTGGGGGMSYISGMPIILNPISIKIFPQSSQTSDLSQIDKRYSTDIRATIIYIAKPIDFTQH